MHLRLYEAPELRQDAEKEFQHSGARCADELPGWLRQDREHGHDGLGCALRHLKDKVSSRPSASFGID